MRKLNLGIKACALACTILFLALPSYGDLQDEKDKKEQMEQELKDTESYLESLEGLKADSEAYIEAIDKRITELALNIYDLQNQVVAKQQEIDVKTQEIADKEAEIEEQYADMAIRIQYMYENGDTQYATMILDSEDMTQLLNRANYISELTQYDRNMLVELQNSKAELDVQKAELQSALNELNTHLEEITAEQQAQETLLSSKQEDLNLYSQQILGANSQIEEIQEDIAAQEAIIKELEELERKRKEQALNMTYDGGQMAWPLPGYSRLSSYFGYRSNPFTGLNTEFHSGIDIPAPSGTVIYAAYDGQVAWSYYSGSAGNWIGIDHGNGIFTVYMHMSGFIAHEGDYVKKGDPIGLVGSTGRSTGPHLHFSVRVNGSYVDPLSYVLVP